MLSNEEIIVIFKRFQEQNPHPASELKYKNPFTLLVAVVLSAQATDKSVNIATEPLFKIADTPEKMLELGEEKLIGYIKSIGLYRNKAKNVIALSQKLISDFNSEVPGTREDLMTLPGVGRKTANVVLNVVFNQPTMPVDTHISRVAPKIGLVDQNVGSAVSPVSAAPIEEKSESPKEIHTNDECNSPENVRSGKKTVGKSKGKSGGKKKELTPDEIEAQLVKVIPQEFLRDAHHWLLLHGRYVCTAKNPKCGECIISDICVANKK